jgi:glycosyltransferase involved in cell wall biosynthesis
MVESAANSNTADVADEPGQGPHPEISVVIPVFDAERTLGACLTSLRAQTLPTRLYEVVVVDNNSRDRSAAVARQTPGVRLVEERRQGAYAARNLGLRVAKGRVIVFTDPDCVPEPDWLEAARSALDGGALVVLGETIPASGSRALELLSAYARVRDEYVFGGADVLLYYGRTNNMAVERSVFDEVGPFAEQPRGADTLLVRAAAARFGTARIRFDAHMRVRHAELDGVGSHFRKRHIYGYVRHRHRDAVPSRRLQLFEWIGLLRETGRVTHGATALPALGVLTVADACSWWAGRLRAAAHLSPPRGTITSRHQPTI